MRHSEIFLAAPQNDHNYERNGDKHGKGKFVCTSEPYQAKYQFGIREISGKSCELKGNNPSKGQNTIHERSPVINAGSLTCNFALKGYSCLKFIHAEHSMAEPARLR
jgi:hypothetical protein